MAEALLENPLIFWALVAVAALVVIRVTVKVVRFVLVGAVFFVSLWFLYNTFMV